MAPSVTSELPSREDFLRTIGAVEDKASPLLRVLLAKLDPEAELVRQLTSLEQLGRFVVAGPAVAGGALARLELLVVALERVPAARERFTATLHAVFTEARAVKLLGEVGLPNDRGLLAETSDRLARKLLPEAPRPRELWRLASEIVRSPSDVAWLGPAADPLLARLAEISGPAWEPLRTSVLDAIVVISSRIAAVGTSAAFRARSGIPGVRESPLYQLGHVEPRDLPEVIAASRAHLQAVKVALEDKGVSIDVVYALDIIERGLERLELLLPFTAASPRAGTEWRALLVALGDGLVGSRSFVQLMSDNLRLLARKVIERAGNSGEHYVTSSRREYWQMFRSAVGGGCVIVFLTAGKFLIKWGHFVPFVDAVAASAAYSAAFLVMQLLGLTLATKQPSMTAAALAGVIRSHGHERADLEPLLALIARIVRSQFAAIVGNIIAVVSVALVFDYAYRGLTGEPFLDAQQAIDTAKSLDPIGSGTVIFAILTGVQLWISSLFAGWFENWVVYRRLPEAIEHHRWGKRFGTARMAWAARFLERHAAGFGGSISLGLLFGFTPQIGAFFGIPLDGRHITITTTSLVLSASSAGLDNLGTDTFVWGIVGLCTIALCNFGVSFTLALLVAMRARDVPRNQQRRLPFVVLRRFVRKPLEFLYPPREEPSAHVHH